MKKKECYICKSESDEYNSIGDNEHIRCPICGEYKVSLNVVDMIKSNKIVLTINILNQAKLHFKKNEVTLINTYFFNI